MVYFFKNDVSVVKEREAIIEADLRIGQFSAKHVRIKGAMLLQNGNEYLLFWRCVVFVFAQGKTTVVGLRS